MNVKELIELLQEQDPECMVITDGYEGGYSPITGAHLLPIKLNVHREWYYGEHDAPQENETPDCIAVYLPR
jgi:hypothetical protein